MKRDALIQCRLAMGKKQADVARDLGVSEVYLRMIEAGVRTPGRDKMLQLEHYYKRPAYELFPDVFVSILCAFDSTKEPCFDSLNEWMYQQVGKELMRDAEIELGNGELEMARLQIDTAINVISFRQPVGGEPYKISAYIYFMQGLPDEGKLHLEAAIRRFQKSGQTAQLEGIREFLVKSLRESQLYRQQYRSLLATCEQAMQACAAT